MIQHPGNRVLYLFGWSQDDKMNMKERHETHDDTVLWDIR